LIERITRTFDYDACLLGLVNDDLDPSAQTNVWLSSSPNHQWNPNQKTPATPWEAEIDRLIRLQAVEPRQPERKKSFDRVQEIMGEQQFSIYVVNRNLYIGLRNRVQGAQPSVLRPHGTWNLSQLWIKGRGGAKLASAQ
jgi:peptide/nickel transport system substrate-binding protein